MKKALLFLLFATVFLKSEKTLWDLLHISEADIWKCSIVELYYDGKMWQERSDAADEEKSGEILDRLRKTKVSLRKWKGNAVLQESDFVYDLMLFDGSKHWLRFYESGEVHILYLGHWIFEMDAADTEEWLAFLQDCFA